MKKNVMKVGAVSAALLFAASFAAYSETETGGEPVEAVDSAADENAGVPAGSEADAAEIKESGWNLFSARKLIHSVGKQFALEEEEKAAAEESEEQDVYVLDADEILRRAKELVQFEEEESEKVAAEVKKEADSNEASGAAEDESANDSSEDGEDDSESEGSEDEE